MKTFKYVPDLPTKVYGVTIKHPDEDDETIWINPSLCHEKQELTYLHEVEHKSDFDDWHDVDQLEAEKHK